jgi:hypothetical protein
MARKSGSWLLSAVPERAKMLPGVIQFTNVKRGWKRIKEIKLPNTLKMM